MFISNEKIRKAILAQMKIIRRIFHSVVNEAEDINLMPALN